MAQSPSLQPRLYQRTLSPVLYAQSPLSSTGAERGEIGKRAWRSGQALFMLACSYPTTALSCSQSSRDGNDHFTTGGIRDIDIRIYPSNTFVRRATAAMQTVGALFAIEIINPRATQHGVIALTAA